MAIQVNLFSPDKPKLGTYEVDEKAAEARAILNNPVFQEALNDICSRAAGTLSTANIGDLTATTAHATMRAIVDIRAQLEQYITDDKMRQKFQKQPNKD